MSSGPRSPGNTDLAQNGVKYANPKIISVEEFRKIKKNKYRAKPVVIDNIRFHSLKEGKRYKELIALMKSGVIRNLELQPEYNFEIDGKRMFRYLADFRYWDGDVQVIEDVKGVKTPVYRLKKKIIEQLYGIKITET